MLSFAIIIIPNSLLERTLPLWLYSVHREIIWPCPPVKGYNKKKRLTYPFQRLALPRDVLQVWRPFLFYFLTASPSLFSILTLFPYFLSLSGSLKQSGFQSSAWWSFETLVCHLLSHSFPNKVIFLASRTHLLELLTYHAGNRVGWD